MHFTAKIIQFYTRIQFIMMNTLHGNPWILGLIEELDCDYNLDNVSRVSGEVFSEGQC